jgi:hypothetical protein
VCVRGWVGGRGGGGGTHPIIMTPPINVLFAIKASLGPTCTFSCFVTVDSFAVRILLRAEKKG